MDSSIWQNLPCDISDKICNLLPKVRQIDERLRNDIVNQWYLYDKYMYNCIMLFGYANYECVMYDDMKHVFDIKDDFSEEMPFTEIIERMWMRLTPEQRVYLIYA
jgi:hypothetical protein